MDARGSCCSLSNNEQVFDTAAPIYNDALINAATFTLKVTTNPVLTLTLLMNDAQGKETLFGITHHLVRTLRQTLHTKFPTAPRQAFSNAPQTTTYTVMHVSYSCSENM